MFRNKIALKLTTYFAVCLLVFSLIISSIFMALLYRHTMQLHKDELEKHALSITQSLSEFMSVDHHANGRGGLGAYLSSLDNISMTDIWIINEEHELIIKGQGHHSEKPLTYKDLPADADKVIDEVFTGKTAFSKSFSVLLNQPTITVGTPIINGDDILGVVLLHSPVTGIKAAVNQGLIMLIISLSFALVISFLLSLWLSKNFTDPIINKEATEALRLESLRRDFVANITHELKTPVAVLRGSLEGLVDQVITEPEQVELYHREMLSETLYLQRLVGDLLDLSRLQNTNFVMEMQEVVLDDILNDAIRSMTHIAQKKSIIIDFQKDSLPVTLQGDYGRLRQMLLIILDNAIKFSPPSEHILITLKGRTLTIEDHGIGIPPESLPYLFDRFYKSRSEQNKTGTGLGLSIAQQIAKRHSVLLTAENTKSGGARFIFTF